MRSIFFHICIISFGVCFSSNLWATACYSTAVGGSFGGHGPGGVSSFYIDPSASVPIDAPDGLVVWRGPSQTVDVTCYKDATNHPALRHIDEQIYFWPGRTGNIGIPLIDGIRVGFRYKGADIFGTQTAVEGFRLQACGQYETNEECEVNSRRSKTITYQPIIVTAPGEFIGYSEPISVFQLDGQLGYNTRYSNYRSVIQNMDILEPSKCLVELKLENDNVDYGRVSLSDVLNIQSHPLNVHVENIKYGPDCPAVKLRGYFNNVRDTSNNSYIPVFDENGTEIESYGIKLYTQTGEEVKLNEPVGDGYEIAHTGYDRYLAKLVPFDPSNIKKGKFEGMVVYTVSYL